MKRFVQVPLLLCLVLSVNLLFAQSPVKNYSFASAAGTYTAITGTNSSAVGDDGTQNGVPIGFNFSFGGRGVTHFCVSTNGFIKLGIGTTTIAANDYANSLTNAPSPNPFYPCIAAFWDNNNRNAGSISYATTGVAGSRILTVQWDGVNIGGSGATSAAFTASFQIKLYEGTNVVKIIYSNTFDNAGPVTASIGLNDQTSFFSVTPGVTPTTSSVTANNTIADLTDIRGKEYTFTPSAPLCPAVTSINVSNITSSGALLTVTAGSGATAYRFSNSTSAEYPSGYTSVSVPTFTLSGLLPNTTYYAQAEVVCSNGNASAWYTVSFTTSCATLSVPYFQNFDTIVAPALPTCLTKEDLNAGASWNSSAAAGQAYSSPNCMVYGSDAAIAGNDWFYTPPISLTGGTSYRISYYYKNQSSVAPEKLEVKYGTAASAAAMTNLIVSNTNITNTTYSVLERDFTPASSGVYHFGFHDFSNANQLGLNIDDIRITTTPACGVPTLLNVSLTGATGVASWTAPTTGTITGYQYAVTTSTTPPASGTATSSTSVNIAGLTAGQQYYLHVRTVCATNSAWSTLPFMAPCTVKQVPYFENFDTAVVVPALQKCYTSQDLNGGSSWKSNTTTPNSSPNSMLYSWDTNLPGDDWFFTPAIHLTAGLSYWLSYYTKADVSFTAEKLEVKYGTANNAAAMLNGLTSNTITGTSYFQVYKSFTPAATGDYYFGFHAFSDANQYNLYVDDIRVNYSTECGPPTGIAVALTPNSGTASWLPSSTGTASTYQYVVTTSATPTETGATTTSTATASFTGLQPATQYYFHVKSLCVSGLYSTWTTYPFTTPCAAVNIPYSENFSTVTIPALPSCMSRIDANGGNAWVTDSSAACTPTKALVYRYNSSVPADDWAFLPGLNLTAGVPYELSFNYKGCNTTDIEKLEIKVGNANGIAAMSNLLYSNLNISGTSYQPGRAGFTPTVSGIYYIGFHVLSAANQFILSIDDISVNVSAFCGQPLNPVVNLTGNTVGTIKWNRPAEGTPASYQYAITGSNIPPLAGTVVNDTTATFSGLLAGTRYFLHIRTTCSNGNTSAWTTSTFTTGCIPRSIPYVENFDSIVVPYLGNCMTLQDLNGGATWKTDTYKPRSAPNSMLYHYDAALPGNDWAYTPGLSLISGITYRLKFYYKARGYNERLQVKWGGTATADSMVSVLWDNIFSDSTIYRLAQVDFTPQRTGVFYIGFHSLSVADQWDLNVDDISVDYAPGCGLPRNLSVNLTSATTATVSWSAPLNGPATGYEFATSTYSATPPASGFFNTLDSFQMVGLLPGVKYYIFVRTACGNGVYSNGWVTDSLYIPCTARNVPYTENFDGVLAPVPAPCIITEDLNGGTSWKNKTVNPRSAPNAMVYSYNNALPGNDWFYMAPLNLTAGTVYRLKFYYKGRSSNYIEKLEVKYGAVNNAAAMTNILFSDTSISSTDYLRAEVDFVPPSTGVYYIGFHAMSAANQFDLNVDDISIDVAPNCTRPGFLSIVPSAYNAALAVWDSTSAGAVYGYEYLINNAPYSPEEGTITSAGHLNIVGLVPEVQYYFHIRTVCSIGTATSLWLDVPFRVSCSTYPLPYYEGFDQYFPPNLPPCVAVQNVNGGSTWSSAEGNSNSQYVSMMYNGEQDRDGDDWFYTPSFNFTAGVSYRFGFYYKGGGGTPEKMEVKYGLGNYAAAMTNLIMRDTNINFSTYRFYQVDFVAPANGTYNIGFHAMSKLQLFVDDISLDRSPSCSQPVNLNVHLINGSGGTITWSPSTPGTPTGYEYVLNTGIEDPSGPGTVVPDSLFILDGLNPFTQYYFHVRTVCATGGNSIWVTTSFYTLPNDEPCNAIGLILNGPQSCGSTVMATVNHDPPLPPGCNAAPNFTIWYKYTPAANGRVILKTSIPATQYPLYGTVGWYTLSGNCTDSASYALAAGAVCTDFGQSGSGDIDSLQSPVLTAGTTYYIMISGIDYNYGDFCLNLISQPGNVHIYRFTGNGNWSNSNNWENQLVPPAYLPGGDLIIIDNAAGGQCQLDVTQYISNTGSIIVNTGKKLVIPGQLKIQ